MAKITETCVIYFDMHSKALHYYSTTNGDKAQIFHEVKLVKGRLYTEEFFQNVTALLSELVEKTTPLNSPNGVLILPDNNVFTNTTSFPPLKGAEFTKSIDAYLNNQYKNNKNLKINRNVGTNNKQYITMNFTGVLTTFLNDFKKACLNARINVQTVSFASCSSVCALQSFNPKEKNASFMFLDIKETFARISCIFKGRVVGFYELPFGYAILNPEKIAAEDVLLYRPVAELAVVNAKERAKQKALTLSGQSSATDTAENFDEDEQEESLTENVEVDSMKIENTIKTLPKKVARKLPKFMLREVPEDEEMRVYENFRLFSKWILDIIDNNDKIFSMGKIENILVNMPSDFDYLYDIANQDLQENNIKYINANLNKEKEEVKNNLEMYGGFFVKSNSNAIKF